jgi:hypothetical protein
VHIDNVVVAIRDAKTKTTFREFQDHPDQGFASRSRERNLVLPFDTEYEFLVRVQDNVRRRLEISIDGCTPVEVVVNPGETVLERWTDSDKRFKFVRTTDSAVTDPSNKLNGRIVVNVYSELASCFFKPVFIYPIYPHGVEWPWQQDTYPWKKPYDGATNDPWWQNLPYTGDAPPELSGHWGINNTVGGCLSQGQNASFIVNSLQFGAGDPGATVEGSKSGQTFSQTTWRGDEAGSYTFAWKLTGRQGPRPGHCVACDTALQSAAKFCHACGKRITPYAG